MKLLALVILSLLSPPALAVNDSDIGVAALVVGGIAAQKNWENRAIAAGSQLLNFGITFGLKSLFEEPCREYSERPDGSSCDGMPSGHTSHSFTGAGNICLASDQWVCGAATAGAAYVGYRRTALKRHTWKQVGVGAGIGVIDGYLAPKVSFGWRF